MWKLIEKLLKKIQRHQVFHLVIYLCKFGSHDVNSKMSVISRFFFSPEVSSECDLIAECDFSPWMQFLVFLTLIFANILLSRQGTMCIFNKNNKYPVSATLIMRKMTGWWLVGCTGKRVRDTFHSWKLTAHMVKNSVSVRFPRDSCLLGLLCVQF